MGQLNRRMNITAAGWAIAAIAVITGFSLQACTSDQPNGKNQQQTAVASGQEQLNLAPPATIVTAEQVTPTPENTAAPLYPTLTAETEETEETAEQAGAVLDKPSKERTRLQIVRTTPTETPPEIASERRETGTQSQPPGTDEISDRYSEQDLACLPPRANTAAALAGRVAQMSSGARAQLNQCLSEDGELQLHLIEQANSLLTQGELECIWRGIRPLDKAVTIEPVPGDDVTTTPIHEIIQGYCTRSDGNSATPGIYIESASLRAQVEALYCLVDITGGAAEFSEWLVGNQENAIQAINEAARGEGQCGADAN